MHDDEITLTAWKNGLDGLMEDRRVVTVMVVNPCEPARTYATVLAVVYPRRGHSLRFGSAYVQHASIAYGPTYAESRVAAARLLRLRKAGCREDGARLLT